MRAVTVTRVVTGLVLGVLLAGCGGASAGDPDPALGPDRAVAADPGGPLEGLGPCGDPPTAVRATTDVPGLHVPAESRVTAVTVTGSVTQVEGWVPLTPVEVRQVMADRADLQVLDAEDEGFESESLLTDGVHETFLKAQAVCRSESIFVALVTEASTLDTEQPPVLPSEG